MQDDPSKPGDSQSHPARSPVGIAFVYRINPEQDLKLTPIEAADRVLPALTPALSSRTHRQLESLGVRVITGHKVTSVSESGVTLDDGEFIAAEHRVRAAGIKAPDWLGELDGLPTAPTSSKSLPPCGRRPMATSSPWATAPPAPRRLATAWCHPAPRPPASRPSS